MQLLNHRLRKMTKGVGKNGDLRYSFRANCGTEYFLSGCRLVHALWLDGKR
ncbi:hypothetical protein D3C76_1782690 [compost metagenome]